MFDEAKRAALADIAREWNKAEKLIKQAERLRGEIVQPSVNELRYAGRRLVDALEEAMKARGDKTKFDGYINDCLLRCLCAQHDAVDASVLFVQKVVKEYENEFGISLMIEKFPWLADTRKRMADMDDIIIECRERRGTRCEGYDELADNYLPKLVDDLRTLLTNRQALEELVAEKDRRDKRETGRFRFNIAVAVVLAAIAIAASWWIARATAPKPAASPPAAAGAPRAPASKAAPAQVPAPQ